MIRIRYATLQDRDDVRNIHLLAFPVAENQVVAELAVSLLMEETSPETFSLIAEINQEVVGHIAFSPVAAKGKKNWLGYNLAPLGVKPEHQKSGVGKKLIEDGIQRLIESGVDTLFVYGDPKYYGRYGFSEKAATHYLPPYKLQYPYGWQAITLTNGGENAETVELSFVESLRDPTLW